MNSKLIPWQALVAVTAFGLIIVNCAMLKAAAVPTKHILCALAEAENADAAIQRLCDIPDAELRAVLDIVAAHRAETEKAVAAAHVGVCRDAGAD